MEFDIAVLEAQVAKLQEQIAQQTIFNWIVLGISIIGLILNILKTT